MLVASDVMAEVPSRGALAAMRGSLFVPIRALLRERGMSEAYWRNLPENVAAEMRAVAVSDWVPTRILKPHYAALDALDMSPSEPKKPLSGSSV